MPMPKPRKGEGQDNFIERCMGDPVMTKDYPEADQRRAVCQKQWDDRKQSKSAGAPDGDITRLTVGGALAAAGVKADEESGLISGVSIITAGQPIGYNGTVDQVTLKQVADILSTRTQGTKSRVTHPEAGFLVSDDGILYGVGRVVAGSIRMEGNRVRGDIQLGTYARVGPHGNVWAYLCRYANEDPDKIGLSIVFQHDREAEDKDNENNETGLLLWRVRDVLAVDFVGDPGANPDGLLEAGAARKQTSLPTGGGRNTGVAAMNKKMRKLLESMGLPADASEETAAEFLAALEGENKVKADKLAAKLKAAADAAAAAELPAEPPAAPPKEPVEPAKDGEELTAADVKKAAREAVAADRERAAEITALCKQFEIDEALIDQLVRGDFTIDEARAKVLEKEGERRKALPVGGGPAAFVSLGANRTVDGLEAAISDAILLRAGAPLVEFDEDDRAVRDENGALAIRKPHERSKQFRHLSLIGMARAYLATVGVPGAQEMSKTKAASLALNRQKLARLGGEISSLAQSTSDFPLILANTTGRRLRAAYEETPSTWQTWARRNTAPDFKNIEPVTLSEAPDLVARSEGGPIIYGMLAETREVYALVEYVRGLKITRRAIINDDLSAFDRIPQLLGAAAMRLEDTVVYAILTANPVMADGVALFNAAAHANDAAVAAAVTVASLNIGRTAMATQQGLAAAADLNLVPVALLAPWAISGVVDQLLRSTADPAGANAGVANIWQNRLQPVYNARLDRNSATAWYLAADNSQIDTIEIAFLEDEQTPVVKSETDFDTEDVKVAVRHTCAAKAIDWRGLFRNTGA